MAYRLAIDIGGTFTDFALVDETAEEVVIHKALTTSNDPSEAVLEGSSQLLDRQGVSFDAVTTITHGTTLVTNAIIERKGACTGMVTTGGFKDVLDIAHERRYDLFDLRLVFPQPLVPRGFRCEVEERIGYTGAIRTPLNMHGLEKRISEMIDKHGLESLAVCLLHSYLNPVHEMEICTFLKKKFPFLYVSASSDVSPFMREYERFTTTTANAYVQPVVDRYILRLEEGFFSKGFGGMFLMMTSSGGTFTAEAARRFPVRLLESGPAAGVLMSAHMGRALVLPNILSYDMGGTTAKGCLIRNGAPRKKYHMEVARVHEFKQGSGLPIKTPVIDMIEIGSGGGSIAWVDARGLIKVGPSSAGASPGPACYGNGGQEPTLTDASLILGYLDPHFFVGGRMALDVNASKKVISENIAVPLGLDVVTAAWGIHEIVNEDCARAFRIHASERGVDYRSCTMVAFGGSGPVHALRISRKLKIPRVLFPMGAGVFSAFGLLVSPLSFDNLRSYRVPLNELTVEQLEAVFGSMAEESSLLLSRAGVPAHHVQIIRRLDMRYQGQGFEIEITLPHGVALERCLERLPEIFDSAYRERYGVTLVDEPLEIVNWKVETKDSSPRTGGVYHSDKGGKEETMLKGYRQIYVPESQNFEKCPVYSRYAMDPGTVLKGPAVVEEAESTCIIGRGDMVTVDEHYNLVAEIQEGEFNDGEV